MTTRSLIFIFSLVALHLTWGIAFAETPTAQVQTQSQTPVAKIAKKPVKKLKGKRIREKEAEGTEALNRFEADTVIKSKYKLNGEPLEVDPD